MHCFVFIIYIYIYILENIRLAIRPPHIIADEGDTVKFECSSLKPVTWKLNDQNFLPDNVQQYSSFQEEKYTLQISNVKRINAGKYECQGELFNKEYYYSIGTLEVNGK